MKRFFFEKLMNISHIIKKIPKYYWVIIVLSFVYAIYISNIASFQSDWAAYYLLFDDLIKGKFGTYYMAPTPILFQVLVYMVPVFLFFGISYKTFYLVIFIQTFINIIALGILLIKLFPPTAKRFPIVPIFVLIMTLTGPLLKIFDSVMYRKDIPLILLAIYYLYSEIEQNKIKLFEKFSQSTIILITFLSIQAFGDPFVSYMILIPLIITNIIFYIFNKKCKVNILRITLYSIISIISSTLIRLFAAKFIFRLYGEASNFTTFDKLPTNISIFLNDINYLIPTLGFFGKPIISLSNINFDINILVIFLLFVSVIFTLYYSLNKNKPFILLIASLPIFSSLIYIVSTRPMTDNMTARYHILFVFIIYIIIFYFIKYALQHNNKIKFAVYLLLTCSLYINTSSFTSSLLHQLLNFRQYNQQEGFSTELEGNINLLNVLNKKSLTKGFAGYWDSSNNTYFSKNRIKIRSILCGWHKVIPHYWFSFQNWYEPDPNIHQSFIYVNKSKHTYTSDCDINDMRIQFGHEKEAIEFEPNKFVYIWEYDISSKIDKYNVKDSELIK